MNRTFSIFPIGKVTRNKEEVVIQISKKYIPALKQLEHFSHAQVLWWADKVDNEEFRNKFQMKPPYGRYPPTTGLFASRAEYRPNPIALTTVRIIELDHRTNKISINNIDALDGTPVLDLKAYFPVCDRVKDVKIPEWIVRWPEWYPEEGFGLEY